MFVIRIYTSQQKKTIQEIHAQYFVHREKIRQKSYNLDTHGHDK
jgi:hypothetical protein